MKGLQIPAVLTLWLFSVPLAHAQEPSDLPQADLAVSLGWVNTHRPGLDTYDDWHNRGLQGAAAAGWYWTENAKAEVEVAVSTTADIQANREITIDGQRAFATSRYTFSTRRLSVSQQYQFGHNAWFHPFVSAGLDLTWERIRQSDEEIFVFDPGPRSPRVVRQPPPDRDRVEFELRPVAAAGFKAYMTPRAFFRTDVRFGVLDGLEDVLVRAGFGIDF